MFYQRIRNSNFRLSENSFYVRNLRTLRLCTVSLAKPFRSLSLSPLLDFIRVPHFLLFRPLLSHPMNRLSSLMIFCEKFQYWKFLDNWQGCLPWFDERHVVISTFSDASNSGWGGVFPDKSGNSVQVHDYWSSVHSSQPIIIREALALKNTLMAGAACLTVSRGDTHVNSLPLFRAWKNQGSKPRSFLTSSKLFTKLLCNLASPYPWFMFLQRVISLMPPSRALSSSDCMLSLRVWMDVEKRWGSHFFDLMALDSNLPLDAQGHPLKHFTPWPTQNFAGVNDFSQTLHHLDNAFVFP